MKREILDQLVAIYCVATSSSGTDQDNRTFIESCPDGWWYSALTPGGKRTVSFQTDADLLPGQQWRKREWFTMRLGHTRHMSALLERHGYEFSGLPQLTSAHSGRLKQFSGDGWLAVGDAAMSFDPLSGQGILKAMQSGIKAAEVTTGIIEAALSSFALSNEHLWANFNRSRNHFYRMEKRFLDLNFWKRRQQ